MEKYLPSFLVNKLDARIAKNEVTDYKPQYKSGRTLLIVAFIYLINIILRGTQGDWANMTVYLVMGFVMVVSAGWNLIAYRRSTEKENSSLNEPSTSFTGGPQTLFPLRSKIALALLCFSLGAVYFGMAAGWVLGLFALIVITASFLKFWQNQKDRQFLTSTAATTDRLRPPKTLNTSPFAQSPPSVTEATTSFLEPMANQIKQEEIETDQDLVNRNR